MLSLSSVFRYGSWWTRPDNNPSRQEQTTRAVLRITSLAVEITGLMVVLFQVKGVIELDDNSRIALISLMLMYAIVWVVNRFMGSWKITAMAPPVIFYIFGMYGSMIWSGPSSFMLFFFAAILMCSTLDDRRILLYMATACSVSLLLVRTFQYWYSPTLLVESTLTTIALLVGTTLFQYYVIGQYQQSIRQVTQTAAALKAEIAQREKAEQELRQERDLSTQLMQTSPVGTVVLDSKGNITFANSSAIKILQLTSSEIKKRTFNSPTWLYTQPDGSPMSSEELPFSLVLASQQPVYNIRHAITNTRGQMIQLRVNAAPLRDGQGKLSGVIATLDDITEQEDNIKALFRSEKHLRTLVSNAPIVLWSTDREGRFQFSDGAGLKKINLLPGQVVGTLLFDLYRDYPEIINDARKALSGEPASSVSIVNGTVFDTRYQPLLGEKGEVVGAIGVSLDVTAQRWAESEMQKQLRRLSALHEIDTAIIHSDTLEHTLSLLLDHISDHLAVDAAAFMLKEPGSEGLQLAAWKGFHGAPDGVVAAMASYTHQVACEQEVLHILVLPNPPQQSTEPRPAWVHEGFQTYIGVPLLGKHQVRGVLALFTRKPFQPSEDWSHFMEILAGQAAIAIDNTRLFQNLQNSHQEISQAYDLTLRGWAKALEMRNEETEGHSQRVVNLSQMLGKEMGLSQSALTALHRGALLHDIGKMAVPDEILVKPGPLNDAEWEIMRMHPVYAFQMLSSIPYLADAIDIPFCHHERWDGSGYPRGLRGEEIPLAARIFTVVDVWDALHTRRTYREAWHEEEIVQYLRAQAGKDLDPQIVDTFLRMLGKS